MPRQTTQKLITALYPRLSHEDTLQGESNSISNQDGICQGVFLQKLQIVQQNMSTSHLEQLSKARTALNWLYSFKFKTYREPFSVCS